MLVRLVCALSDCADGYSWRAGRIAVLCAAYARRIRIFSGMFLFGYIAATPCWEGCDPTAVACAILPKRCEDLFQSWSFPDDDRAMWRRDRERGRPLQAGGRLPASAARPAPGVPGVRGQARVIRRHCWTARRGRLDRVRYGPRTACADRVHRHRALCAVGRVSPRRALAVARLVSEAPRLLVLEHRYHRCVRAGRQRLLALAVFEAGRGRRPSLGAMLPRRARRGVRRVAAAVDRQRGGRHTKHCSYLSGCSLLIQVEETWLP